MFNLLPENLRKKIITDYKLRLLIVVLSFLVLLQISFLIFLFPSWLTSHYREKDFIVKSEELNRSISALDVSSTTAFIKSINEKLGVINQTLEYPKFIPIIDSIISSKSSSIRVDGIFYTVNTSNTGVLTINGMGDKRDSLVAFTDALKKVDSFKKVDLPISNLAKDKNIDFTISVNIEK